MKKALSIALMVAFSAALALASENTTTSTNAQKHPTTKTAHKNLKKGVHKRGKKGKKSSGGTYPPPK